MAVTASGRSAQAPRLSCTLLRPNGMAFIVSGRWRSNDGKKRKPCSPGRSRLPSLSVPGTKMLLALPPGVGPASKTVTLKPAMRELVRGAHPRDAPSQHRHPASMSARHLSWPPGARSNHVFTTPRKAGARGATSAAAAGRPSLRRRDAHHLRRGDHHCGGGLPPLAIPVDRCACRSSYNRMTPGSGTETRTPVEP
jgi:hypothetical protein